MTRTPDVSSLLSSLTRDWLAEIGQILGVSLPARARKEEQIETLLGSAQLRFATLLGMLHRDELKGACHLCGLDDGGRGRQVLARRLRTAAGEGTAEPAALFAGEDARRTVPRPGDVVRVRHRQYLVEEVSPPGERRSAGPVMAHRVRLVSLDDDSQGRPLESSGSSSSAPDCTRRTTPSASPRPSTRPGASPPTSQRSAGTESPPRTRVSSRPLSAPASG